MRQEYYKAIAKIVNGSCSFDKKDVNLTWLVHRLADYFDVSGFCGSKFERDEFIRICFEGE